MTEPPNGPPGAAGDPEETAAVCVSLLAAYDADQFERPLWLQDPVRYRSPYARFVRSALIRSGTHWRATDASPGPRVFPTR